VRPTIVVIDDDPISVDFVAHLLEELPVAVLKTACPEEGLEMLAKGRSQMLLVDYKMPGMDGMAVIDRALEANPDVYAMLMTAHYSTESAVAAIERGACDYFEKPVGRDRLRDRITRILSEMRERETAEEIESSLLSAARFEGLIGRSPEMLAMFAKVRHVAPHFRTALVTGETGTGKDLVAQALHKRSPVANAPFAVLNCSAVVESLFESELFGHAKGAFTGAIQDKVGVFEYANGGTVFLDEIGELPLTMQAKLLRVLQQQEVQRVGSPVPRKVNVRIVAATNRDLRQMVRNREFREDLFYRLSMVEIKVPALAKRGEDIPLLLRFMTDKYAQLYNKPIHKMTLRCQQLLLRYDWPGNVREMENVIGSACMMAQGSVLDTTDLPDMIREAAVLECEQASPTAPGFRFNMPFEQIVPLHDLERRYVLYVLDLMNGNKLRTAEALKIGRATLYRLLADESQKEEEASSRALAVGSVQ
jgi:DNA-binding NtrC family response regulator